MKVIQILPALEQGGVEHVVCDLNRVVVESGNESVVISKGGRLVADIERAGGRHISLDVKSKNPLTAFARAAQLKRVLKAEKPDLVCVHSRVPAWLFVLANRSLHLKWISYAHGANSVSRYSAVMTKGDLVVTPSHFLARFLEAHYTFDAKKLRVVSPAVDAVRFDPTRLDTAFMEEKRREWKLDGAFTYMAVGRLSPLKGLDALIRELPGDAKLVIVGEADHHHRDYEVNLRATAGDNVVFAGPQSKIPECLALADVVVSSNRTKPESFGLSLIEALAMEKPVVAKAFGGAAEIVRPGLDGILVDGDDFRLALEEIRARRFDHLRDSAVSRYGFPAMAEKTLTVYRELVR